jgi:hypothetical protein
MIYNMADLIQFQRSRDRLMEILHQVIHKNIMNTQTAAYIKTLEMSIKTLDQKIEEFKCNPPTGNTYSFNI